MFTEKRVHLRIPLTYVTVDVFSSMNEVTFSETGTIIDMSVNGLGFISKKHYEISQPKRNTFVLPGSTIPIRANAVIIYQIPRNELLHTGIQFTNIGLAEFALMKKYIETMTKKN